MTAARGRGVGSVTPAPGRGVGRSALLQRSEVLGLLESNRLAPSRALGQNFVVDANTLRRIARLAGVGPGDRVLEIGAGLGSLSLALAETGSELTAVELDRRLLPVLRQVVSPAGVTVVEGDAMHMDWQALLVPPQGWVMVANLPYNIATPLVADLLDDVPAVSRMLVMVQREVAERLVAAPGDPAYGAVSVKVAYWASAKMLGSVPSSVFVPRPRVDSALVSISRRPERFLAPPPAAVFTLVRAGFAHRRKMLRTCLDGLLDDAAFEAAGIAPTSRAEELGVGEWLRLASAARAVPAAPGASR